MSRALTKQCGEHQQLADEVRTKAVTDLLCIEAQRNPERELLESAAKETLPALARKARRKLLQAAACCTDASVARELRRIAQLLGWALDDVSRNLRRQCHDEP